MAWIKTVRPEDGDDALRAALAAQQALYPAEYARPDPAGTPTCPGSWPRTR